LTGFGWTGQGGSIFSALGENAVTVLEPNGSIKIAVTDPRLRWPDTFSQGPDGAIYITASHIQDSPWFHLRVISAAGRIRRSRSSSSCRSKARRPKLRCRWDGRVDDRTLTSMVVPGGFRKLPYLMEGALPLIAAVQMDRQAEGLMEQCPNCTVHGGKGHHVR
jgi:hypothetical protein